MYDFLATLATRPGNPGRERLMTCATRDCSICFRRATSTLNFCWLKWSNNRMRYDVSEQELPVLWWHLLATGSVTCNAPNFLSMLSGEIQEGENWKEGQEGEEVYWEKQFSLAWKYSSNPIHRCVFSFKCRIQMVQSLRKVSRSSDICSYTNSSMKSCYYSYLIFQ